MTITFTGPATATTTRVSAGMRAGLALSAVLRASNFPLLGGRVVRLEVEEIGHADSPQDAEDI